MFPVLLGLFLKVLIDVLDLQLKRARTGPASGSHRVDFESDDSEYDALHHGLDPSSINNVSNNCATFHYNQD